MRVAFNSPARNQVWGSRSMGGPLACNQQMRVRLPPLPPISPGRPLRSRRRSETPDKHVRLVLLAPTVTVAEWLRRATVNRSTRVQFSPVTPFAGRSFSGQDAGLCSLLRQFESAPPNHVERIGRSSSQPGRSAAGRNSLKVDVDGSSPSPATKVPPMQYGA